VKVKSVYFLFLQTKNENQTTILKNDDFLKKNKNKKRKTILYNGRFGLRNDEGRNKIRNVINYVKT